MHSAHPDGPNRMLQVALIAATSLACWLGMQAVHELGHVLGAMVSGGTIDRVVLNPLQFSRTDLLANPHPLVVVWSGPIMGVLMPIGLWLIARTVRLGETFLLRFFAGFCLVANGVYVSLGSFDSVGDAGDMLTNGSPAWSLWCFGLITVPLGLWLWHGQGRHFGLGRSAAAVHRRGVMLSLAILAGLLIMGFAVGGE